MSAKTVRTFVTQNGDVLGQASVPEDYRTFGNVVNEWQSETVPFSAAVSAASPDGEIVLSSFSKELFHDLKNIFIRTIVSLVAAHTESGYVPFRDEQEYFLNMAVRRSGISDLQFDNKYELPTDYVFKNRPDTFLQNDIDRFGTFVEIQPRVISGECRAIMYRFRGTAHGKEYYVYAGGDWQKADLTYRPSAMDSIAEAAGKVTEKIREAVSNATGTELPSGKQITQQIGDIITGKDKMSFREMMQGGLIGKMMREKGRKQEAVPDEPAQQSAPAEEEQERQTASHILYGTQRSYFCMCSADRNAEAVDVLVEFIESFEPDSSLADRETQEFSSKMASVRQQAGMNQQLALQKEMQLRRMQAETSRMISENSRQASAGLMDSFNKRMKSQDRISKEYSEAIRGVDTYTNSYGQTYDVDLAADHVYENRYGDVYGVSGTALDNETLNKLGWEEKSD